MNIHRRMLVPVIVFLVLLVGSISIKSAQDKTLELNSVSQLPYSQQAKTIPVSDLLITLKLSVDENEPILASQFDGGMIRIELLKKEGLPIYGFSPYISDATNGAISVRVFQINRIIKDGELKGESMKEITTLAAYKENDKYTAMYAEGGDSFTFELIDVQKSEKYVELKGDHGELIGAAQCCLVCNGVRSCACAVSTSCGSCCAPECCG
jgi:hypothetical protein